MTPEQRRAARERCAKATLTIGVGILCQEGIVLASDQQVTASGLFKRYEEKLRRMGDNKRWSAIFSYAGNPDFMHGFYRALTDHLNALKHPVTDSGTVRESIEQVLLARYSIEDIANLQLLCGVSIWGKETRLFKNSGHRVGDLQGGVHYVGCGESSLLSFLSAQVANMPIRTIGNAVWVATYLVYAAKKWIDGCGGATDVWSLRDAGTVITETAHVAAIERMMTAIEAGQSNVLSALFTLSDQDQFDVDLDNLCKRLRDEYLHRTA